MNFSENVSLPDCTTLRMLALSQCLLLIIIVAVLYSLASISVVAAAILGIFGVACLGIVLIHREDGTLIFEE